MEKRRSVGLGVALVLVGVWALAHSLGMSWASMDRFWPAILVGVGLLALANGLAGEKDPDGVWFGTTAILCGLLFLYVTLGWGEWSDFSWLWPAFPVAAGVGWVVSWLADLGRVSNLATGLAAIAVGVLGFAYTSGRLEPMVGRQIASLWPLVLVVIGIGLIIQFVLQRR